MGKPGSIPVSAIGPTYQEDVTHTFLVHSMKRPRVVRMGDDRLVLMATAWIHQNNVETPIILHSDDEGESWSQPRELPRYGQLACLGGKRLMLAAGGGLTFSDDGGETWGGGTGAFQLPDGRHTLIRGSFLVEDDDVRVISYSEADPHGPTGWSATSWLWHSPNAGLTWGDPIALPPEWCTSEGSVTRAKDGALVASLSTAQAPGLPSYSDHWRRVTTARSTDFRRTPRSHAKHYPRSHGFSYGVKPYRGPWDPHVPDHTAQVWVCARSSMATQKAHLGAQALHLFEQVEQGLDPGQIEAVKAPQVLDLP